MVCPDPQVGPKNGPLRPQSVGWSPRGFTSSVLSSLDGFFSSSLSPKDMKDSEREEGSHIKRGLKDTEDPRDYLCVFTSNPFFPSLSSSSSVLSLAVTFGWTSREDCRQGREEVRVGCKDHRMSPSGVFVACLGSCPFLYLLLLSATQGRQH